jgi:photosystem II stability/assembly factor-like uncharacterized protein
MRIFCLCAMAVPIVFSACNKDGNSVSELSKGDTLTAGWTKKIVSPGTLFSDIFFSNNQIGFVAGKEAYKTSDGGLNWNKVNSFTSQTPNIAITNDNKFFAVLSDKVYRTTDFGATYTSPTLGDSAFTDVVFLDNNTGFCVGTGSKKISKTTDGGITWQAIGPIKGINSKTPAYATACFFSPTSGVMAVNDSIYKSKNNLNDWTTSSISVNERTSYFSLFAVSPTIIFAGSSGIILQSTDGGASFSFKAKLNASSSSYQYVDLHFIDKMIGYASYRDRIYKTTDGGSNWQTVVTLGNSNISEIHFTDANHGWGCTDKGEILKYNL